MNALSIFNPKFASEFFDDFAGFLPSENLVRDNFAMPRVDVRENADKYTMDVDLPGVEQKDVDLNVKNRVLTISTKKSEEKKEKKDGNYIIRERRTFDFSRKFTLGDDVNVDDISAKFSDGVLTVEIPKRPQESPRQIQIAS